MTGERLLRLDVDPQAVQIAGLIDDDAVPKSGAAAQRQELVGVDAVGPTIAGPLVKIN